VRHGLLQLEGLIEATLTAGILVSAALLIAGLGLAGESALRLGIVLLMLTPVARVVILTVGLLLRRDWRFGLTSLVVLLILASGL
jgi:hypothetical protein